MADPRANSAVRAGQHVLPSYQFCIANQPLGHEVRVFDEIRTMADDTRDQGRAIWRSRRVFTFHRPETLRLWLSQPETLRADRRVQEAYLGEEAA